MMMGLSVFALAPYQSSQLGKRMGRSLQIEQLESYMENHGANDKAALSEIVGNEEPIPTTWERVKDYVQHDIYLFSIIFGPECVGLHLMEDIYHKISACDACESYQPISFATFMWQYHVARMDIFQDVKAARLENLLELVTKFRVPQLEDCPVDVQLYLKKAAGIGPDPNRLKRGACDDTQGSGNQPSAPKKLHVTSALAKNWVEELAVARNAVHPLPLASSALCPDFFTSTALFGKDFLSCFPKQPCNNFVLMGSCRYGNACRFSHEPTSEPSASVVAGVKARLHSLVEEIAAKAKN
jgi:hypothetical protein